jgi:hypothetical protein
MLALLPSHEATSGALHALWASRGVRRVAGFSAALVVFCLACVFMERGLREREAFRLDPGRVAIEATLGWAKPELGARIKHAVEDDLRNELRDLPVGNAFEEGLCDVVAERLARNAWVARVVRVERRFPRGASEPSDLRAILELRTPLVCVESTEGYVVLDCDGVRLPLSLATEAALRDFVAGSTRPMRLVRGAGGKPPMPGEKWVSEEINAALSLERVLQDVKIDGVLPIDSMRLVGIPQRADERGRVRYEPGGGVLLVPDQRILPGTILLWGRAPVHAGTIELSVREKVEEIRRRLAAPGELAGRTIDLTTRGS